MQWILGKIFKALKFVISHRYRLMILTNLRQNAFSRHPYNFLIYKKWIQQNEPDRKELSRQRSAVFGYMPKISIVVPLYNTQPKYLKALFYSILNQTYENWEVCLADGSNSECRRREQLIQKIKNDSRFKYKQVVNKGISYNTNQAILLSEGEYISFLDHDDVLAPFSLYEFTKAINENPETDIFYSDEDHLSIKNRRILPYFKPDFSKEFLRSTNYICHQVVVRKSIGDRIGWLREGMDGAQDHDFLLRVTDLTNHIVHIPKILYHWREIPGSAAYDMKSKMYAFEAGKKAIQDHLKRNNIEGLVTDGHGLGFYRIFYRLNNRPLVSIIIPNKDNWIVLEKCINSILNTSTYHNYEIIIIENSSTDSKTFDYYEKIESDSKIRVLRWEKPFNYAKINNYGAKHANGEFFLFLNNDIQVINPDWVERMIEHFAKPDVGVVGAKLYFPNNTIEHGGFFLGIRGFGSHSHIGFPRNSFGYFGRLITVQNYTAVTGACLLTKRDIFEEVKGFDEQFEYNYNDVDYCLKIKEKGYCTIWTPYTELYHHECQTRKEMCQEQFDRFLIAERDKFRKKWPSISETVDPYYNPNLHNERDDFSIKI
ncbi:glycosyltransferase family 2 protein [Candidatus Parcubacteria bacterium]|nr:MAG: glycosyltransferase family 2 protein [Candidatus Parcubacteria bacterium]